MSIAAIGGGPSQTLAALLSKLTATMAASSSSSTDTVFSASPGTPAQNTADNTLTGSATGQLSADVLGVLLMMQGGAGASQTAPASTSTASAASASNSADPLSSLVSAIDTNGDGTISQSELEAYIQNQGGTQAQADALYTGLDQNGSSGLNQSQLQSDLQSAAPARRGHHGHHHHGQLSANDVGAKLVTAMDSNSDGSVDSSEFASFVTSLGGTDDQASADFAALQGQGGGGITATAFGDAVSAFAQSASGGSPILNLLDGMAKTVSSTSSTAA